MNNHSKPRADEPPPIPVRALDYQARVDGRSRLIFHWPVFIALLIIVIPFVVIMAVVVPRYEDVFKDFGTKLPVSTMWLLTVQRIVKEPVVLVGIAMMTVGIPFATGALRGGVEGGGRRRFRLVAAAIYISIAMCLLAAFLLILPMYTLVQAVSGGGGK